MKHIRRTIIFILLLMCTAIPVNSATYTVNVGKSITIKCTANPPAGYITHAFFELADPSDAQYVTLYSHSKEQYATITGLSAASSVKILVTYYYTFSGTYVNQRQVQHASYYEYVTVKGGAKATKIEFVPTSVTIKPGATTRLQIKLTPANTSSTWEWGEISSLTTPGAFNRYLDGNYVVVTSKKAGTLYVGAVTDNNKQAAAVVYAKENAGDKQVEPTSIKFKEDTYKVTVGDYVSPNYVFEPDNAISTLTWESKNEKVATVSSVGRVEAVGPGNTVVTVKTENGLSASVNIVSLPAATAVSLPASVDLYKGYSYQLKPETTPAESEPQYSWKTSSTAYASVTSKGLVKAKKEGSATITASTSNKLSATCKVNIVTPPANYSTSKVAAKITTIKGMALQAITNK